MAMYVIGDTAGGGRRLCPIHPPTQKTMGLPVGRSMMGVEHETFQIQGISIYTCLDGRRRGGRRLRVPARTAVKTARTAGKRLSASRGTLVCET
jgi:hypothetical protein